MAGEPTFEDAYNSTMSRRIPPRRSGMHRLSPEAQVASYRQFIANGKHVLQETSGVIEAHLKKLGELDSKMAEHERLEVVAVLRGTLDRLTTEPEAAETEGEPEGPPQTSAAGKKGNGSTRKGK